MKKNIQLLVVLLALAVLLAACSSSSDAPPPRANVAFMTSTTGTPNLGGASWGTDAGGKTGID